MQSGNIDKNADLGKQEYIKGLQLYRDGELKGACAFFTRAIDAGIDDFDILYYRGMCYLDGANYLEALTDFEVLVRHDPDNPEYQFRRGFIHYKLGKNGEAMRDFGLIPKEYDDFSIRWHYLAVLLFKAGDPESALAAIEKALFKFPTMPKVWFNAGVILAFMDIHDRADLAFATAVKLDSRLEGAPRRIME
jgi:tetratricopeptide (TPR) repeat protein